MIYAISLLWLILIYITKHQRDAFLMFFVFTQFLFVAFGLILFPMLGQDFLTSYFSAFNLSNINEYDFAYANLVIFTGTTTTLGVYTMLGSNGVRKRRLFASNSSPTKPENTSLHKGSLKRLTIYFLSLITILGSIYFTYSSESSIFAIVQANSNDDLAASTEMRYSATSNYLLTIAVYNLFPATSLVSLLLYKKNRNFRHAVLFGSLSLFTSFALIATYQKRPFMVFLIAIGILWKFGDRVSGDYRQAYGVLTAITRQWWSFVLLFFVISIFYYFYTTYRFSGDDPYQVAADVTAAVSTRIVGRLSLPAAMYVDYFPSQSDFYWFTNVGLLASITNATHYPDSQIVFSHYSISPLNGSVAASVFTDAYGQGGLAWVPVVGTVVAFVLLFLRSLFSLAASGPPRALLFIFCLIFIYYLSQASLFRAILGYGGLIYFAVWLASTKKS